MAVNIPSVEKLVEQAQDIYKNEFNNKAEVAVFGPGRVNLIGEHTDYNEGFVLPMVYIHCIHDILRNFKIKLITINYPDIKNKYLNKLNSTVYGKLSRTGNIYCKNIFYFPYIQCVPKSFNNA